MRGPHEFEIGTTRYSAVRMDARTQMHVARRITPLLVGLIPALTSSLSRPSPDSPAPGLLNLNIQSLLPGLQSAADLLASMKDEEFDYVQNECLSLVRRQRPGDTGWTPIWNKAVGRSLFDDIEAHELLSIMISVLRHELAPFMVGLVSSLTGDSQP